MLCKRRIGLLCLLLVMVSFVLAFDTKEIKKYITEQTIYVEGLQEDYTLLFLTDIHAVIMDPEAQGQQAENQVERAAMFVNWEGISAEEQLAEWIDYANENQVDAVLLGGDIIDTPSKANLEWLEEQLSRLDMPWLYVLGNHDWTYPWEYMTDTGKETYLPLFEPFMQGNTAIQRLDLGEFSVVGIDNSSNQVRAEVLAEYEKILAEGEPMVVMAHVPFLTQSILPKAKNIWSSPVVIGGDGGIYPDENSRRFTGLTTAADSPVELVLTGHVHFYDQDVIAGEKDVFQLTGGAGYLGEACLIHLTGNIGTENTER
ncbi:MAG: hypothetical protein HDR02_11945 [Lachnospiraceae bacterium]|nr:hypothetical protein [Lachnospiraceae bacterium]